MSLPVQPIPAPGFKLISGKRSPTEGEYHVQFRNGYVCKWTYAAPQLRWIHTGSDWDVAAVRKIG